SARLEVPVVPRLDDEPLVVEAQHRATGDRLLLAARQDEDRPPFDGRPIAFLDGLAEADILCAHLGEDPRRVREGRLRPAERRRAEDAVVAVEGGRGGRVSGLPRDAVGLGPAPGEAVGSHGASLLRVPAPGFEQRCYGPRVVTKRIVLLVALLGVVGVSAASARPPGYSWHDTPTGTTAHFRGLSAVSATTAWVSGYTSTDGVVMRTTDRGATWQDVSPPGAAGLQFRDIEAFDANHAVAMSIGGFPTDFRIYVTSDGGQTWSITQQNTNPGAFYDCMTFFNSQ